MNEDLKKTILEKVHQKEISMHSRGYFLFRVVALICIAIIAFALLAFSLSFVFFSIHQSGEQFLLGFGMRGIIAFLILFPWGILIFTILLFFFFEWLLRYFKFSYRLPMVKILLYTLLVTVLVSIIVVLSPVHLKLLKEAEMDKLPLIGRFYESIEDSHQNEGVLKDTVLSIQPSTETFIVSHNDNDSDEDDGTWNVIPPAHFDLNSLSVGEKVYVAGTIKDDTIYAYGIQQFPVQ